MAAHCYPPIYTDRDQRFRADCCLPLVESVARGEMQMQAFARGHYPGQRLGRGDLTGVKSVGFWDAPKRQSWGLGWHRNEGLEITFCESGQQRFAVDGFACTLNDGDLTVTRPWQLHRLGDPAIGAGRLHWLILDVGVRRPNQPWRWPKWIVLSPGDLAALTDRLRCTERVVWSAAGMRSCFEHMAGAIAQAPAQTPVSRLAVAINDLLLRLSDMLRSSPQPGNPHLSNSRHAVQLFLQDVTTNAAALVREWSVEQMAAACGLGRTQFLRYCRQITKMSPASFLRHCRLEAAARLLRDARRGSITAIAMDCGFGSSQYFATAFQKQFGCSPRAYRHRAVEARAHP